jgi:isoleucyl-tRNA synthetase
MRAGEAQASLPSYCAKIRGEFCAVVNPREKRPKCREIRRRFTNLRLMFQPVEGNVNFPKQEEDTLRFWKEHRIYEKSLEQRAGAEPFVFYEGPPTANGMPHPGHCLTRAIKDLFPRYKTMRGYRCERKAGWDTHGLPVEVEVCKELGIHAKEEIEAYGVEKFIQKCQASVWRYMQEWERLTERIGFWVDLEKAYVTYHQSYVESVWWSLKNLFDRGLLYQGHKIVWWWAQGGTALSSHEVGLGYRQVADPSVYVKFPIVLDDHAKQLGLKENTNLLIWTTTPWTLPSNQFVAINPTLIYEFVEDEETNETILVANNCLTEVRKRRPTLFGEGLAVKGTELIGLRYRPPFDYFSAKHSESTEPLLSFAESPRRFAEVNLRYYHEKGGIPPEVVDKIVQRHNEDVDKRSAISPYWRVVPASFVTTESGTGLVHIAPAYGEADAEVLSAENLRFAPEFEQPLRMFNPVSPNGKFTSTVSDFEGEWVKACDKGIVRFLKERGLIFHQEQYLHDYPFCWRAPEDALIQYPRKSWFIRTTDYKGEMLANNSRINWLPEHIKDGRFGKFLESNVDWALSRERYWGTPLPIWICNKCGNREAIASYCELMEKSGFDGDSLWRNAKSANPDLPEDLKVHKPYIDNVEYRCDTKLLDNHICDGRMQRVSEVIDAWYDSGSMPFAQWGYPSASESEERFTSQFPADFISEAIDQTRGWFYSQLATSTLLFGKSQGDKEFRRDDVVPSKVKFHPYPHPFKNCIVLGLMLGEDGQKMSKSKRNYLPPSEIFDRYGADALRWYFFANQPPWTTIRYSEQAIKDSIPEFLLRLWNVYSFFVIYANIDEFAPTQDFSPPLGGEGLGEGGDITKSLFTRAKSYRPVRERSELDRWILSELNRTCSAVVERMDAYDNFGACQRITEFVDALSNWYVRRSRDRFWAADKRLPEKLDAYWTLYESLLTTAKLVAPFVPFVAETLWKNLARSMGAVESVHLCNFPVGDPAAVDEALSVRMNLVREVASLGRNARNAANLKVRQPLAKVEVVLADEAHQKWLEEHADLIAEELNVKAVEFTTHGEEYISYSVVPNFKRLGPRLGKNMPAAKKLLGEVDAGKLLSELKSSGKVALKLPDGSTIDLDNEDIEVRLTAKEGWAAAQGKGSVVVLATELTPELEIEGTARDIVRQIQDHRKVENLEYTDRIEVGIETQSEIVKQAVNLFGDYIAGETLANKLAVGPIVGVDPTIMKVADGSMSLYMKASK